MNRIFTLDTWIWESLLQSAATAEPLAATPRFSRSIVVERYISVVCSVTVTSPDPSEVLTLSYMYVISIPTCLEDVLTRSSQSYLYQRRVPSGSATLIAHSTINLDKKISIVWYTEHVEPCEFAFPIPSSI